ncbi:alpha/beta fold hydrolase [Cryptosporangium arvum]|uniref:Putative hydrolase or acyltransferase of alpha/beta superfamily n=1 Tax=Cryptosporangium arvum DSM 44712 TaxID=927661 RepID=A0A010ZXV7_9ACTN|nr:alpha/beta hydrolase [Cryptosporangium arvum]EXG82052.1 putative hydrolase or acyltransferase of alpha/beta superfamily [Cryptosporangium arvum DSM 44712]
MASKPTVVLVHGAFADSSGWGGTIVRLLETGYSVVAASNPLRSAATDAAQVRALVDSIDGPVVLVGHSYGGVVVSAASVGARNVRALVFVAAFAPANDESAATLSSLYPGSTLGDALRPVQLPDGDQDLYIDQERFHAQFCADVPDDLATLMAATQRPITAGALNEAVTGPQGWESLSSYFLIAGADRNIPAPAQHFMAERAKGVVREVANGSHAVFVAHPDVTASLIDRAAGESA